MPLKCDVCGKDLLNTDLVDKCNGAVVFVEDVIYREENDLKSKYVDIYFACKGDCDDGLEERYCSKGYSTGWQDISDLVILYKLLNFNMGY